jgi:UDP-glucose 4-epimerase
MIKNKKIFITGGAGFLGKSIIEKYYNENLITVYSRDEAKHFFLKKKYPKINFIIGDIQNQSSLIKAGRGHDIGIFAASLKQIDAVDQNIEESIRIIVNGGLNSRICAEENGFESACFISTDKSRSPTTLYGAMKFVAGESFIINSDESSCKKSSVIYGNVINSTGSVIPSIWNAINNNFELTLFSEEMTRFIITAQEAVELIDFSLNINGFNVTSPLYSMRIVDLFEIFSNKFNLKYKIGKPRVSEKAHEILFSKEEARRVTKFQNKFLMHPKKIFDEFFNEFSSESNVLEKNDLETFLESNNYFKQ